MQELTLEVATRRQGESAQHGAWRSPICLHPGVGLIQPAVSFGGLPQPLMAHGQDKPVENRQSRCLQLQGNLRLSDGTLEVAGAVMGQGESVSIPGNFRTSSHRTSG